MKLIKRLTLSSLIALGANQALAESVSYPELVSYIEHSSLFGPWDLSNKTVDPLYQSEPTGVATWYTNGTMSVDQGSFAAAGIISKYAPTKNPCSYHEHYFNWQVFGDVSVIYLNWLGDQHSTLQPTYLDATLRVANIDLDKTTGLTTFTLIGDGGCAVNPGVSRISIMSRTLTLLPPPPAE